MAGQRRDDEKLPGRNGKERPQISEKVFRRARNEKHQEHRKADVRFIPKKTVFGESLFVNAFGAEQAHESIYGAACQQNAQKAQQQPGPGAVKKARSEFNRFTWQESHHHLKKLDAQKDEYTQHTLAAHKFKKASRACGWVSTAHISRQ